VAGKLGLRLDYQAQNFGQLIGLVNAGKITMAISSMTDKASRQGK
jgi:hypothetical protein